jgi:hypothetical protein
METRSKIKNNKVGEDGKVDDLEHISEGNSVRGIRHAL